MAWVVAVPGVQRLVIHFRKRRVRRHGQEIEHDLHDVRAQLRRDSQRAAIQVRTPGAARSAGTSCWSVRKTGVPSLHMHWEPLFNDRVIFWKISEVILKTLARWLATRFVCAGFEAMQGTGAAGVLGCARPCVAIRTFYLLSSPSLPLACPLPSRPDRRRWPGHIQHMNASLALSHAEEEGPFGDISCQQADKCAGRTYSRAFPRCSDKSTDATTSRWTPCPGNQARPLGLSHPAHGRRQGGDPDRRRGGSLRRVRAQLDSELHRHRRHRLLRRSVRQRRARSQPEYGRRYPRYGTETWTGTLEVPGLEFDVTRPTLTGATSKKVKAKKGAKSARVVFRVTAQDDRDGALPVSCAPRSGKRLPNRQDPGELHRERFERQRRQGVVHRHRPAPPVVRPRKRRPERYSGAGRREYWGSQVEVRRLAVGRARRYGTD